MQRRSTRSYIDHCNWLSMSDGIAGGFYHLPLPICNFKFFTKKKKKTYRFKAPYVVRLNLLFGSMNGGSSTLFCLMLQPQPLAAWQQASLPSP